MVSSIPESESASGSRALWLTRLGVTGRAGLTLLALLAVAAAFGPYLVQNPYAQDLSNTLHGPTTAHFLGTDQLGRDVLARILIGARLSLLIGFGATLIGSVVGTAIGALGAYVRGPFELVMMRIVEMFLVFPGILIALMVIAVAGQGVGNVILAVGLRAIPIFARLAQTSTQAVLENDFIVAARAIGASDVRILWAHILPALLNSIIVIAALQVATSILIGATLSFLGVGVSPETPEWGAMLNEGRRYLFQDTALVIFPGIAIMVTVLGINLFGDGLRGALDPRTQRSILLGR